MRYCLVSLGLCLLSGLLFFLSIHWWWPLVFVSLSPLAICFCCAHRWWHAALWAGVSGTLMWYFIQYPLWIYNHAGIFLLACYQSISVILMALGIRAVWKRWQIPLVWIWPVAVVAGEYLRMIGLLGVPFGSLAGACREQSWMLQVCDLGGIYTLSFPIAMVQGWVADFFLKKDGVKRRPVMAVSAIWAAVAIYGQVRPAQIEAGMKPGPQVAVVQPDVVYVLNSIQGYDPNLLLAKLKELTEQSAQAGDPPELFVWPEGISSFPLRNRELIESPDVPEEARREMTRFEGEFSKWVKGLKAPLIVGMDVVLPAEDQSYRYYNSAQIYDPEIGQTTQRQFKMRLYPGGEYFPWAGTWIDEELSEREILPSVFGIKNKYEPGTKREVFQLDEIRYAISTCSEILSPVSSGTFHPSVDGKKPFDFLINIANEGTFLRNAAQIHQFAYLPFRSIEARVGIARSSNTGMSGFVSPTGEVYSLVTNERGQARTGLGAPELDLIADLIAYREANEKAFKTDPLKRKELNRRIAEVQTLRKEAGIEGFSVDRVYTYPEMTLYQRFGDWLGISCLVGLSGISLFTILQKPKQRNL